MGLQGNLVLSMTVLCIFSPSPVKHVHASRMAWLQKVEYFTMSSAHLPDCAKCTRRYLLKPGTSGISNENPQ